MKKIWIWNHYATNMFRDEGGRHYSIARELTRLGYQVMVFCANTFHNTEDFIDTNNHLYTVKEKKSIKFVFIKTKVSNTNGFDRIINMTDFYRNLFPTSKQIYKDFGKPDVILASSVHPLTMVAGIKVAKKLNIPCICEIRDLWPEAIFEIGKVKEKSILGKVLLKGEHWIYRNADALIFTKEGDTDYIKEKKWDVNQGGDIDLNKAHYINNGVDLDQFNHNIDKYKYKELSKYDSKFNIVYTGAIRPVNNVENIVNTAQILKNERDIQFFIFGEGNQKEKLETKVEEFGLDNIHFKGQVNKKYIPSILSQSSVNLLNYSSKMYNWTRGNSSNKLFEYLASGKPVISTMKMGYSIIKKYQCGIELGENTPESLANTILKLKKMKIDDYNKMCENSKNAARDFDYKVLTRKLIDIIESL